MYCHKSLYPYAFIENTICVQLAWFKALLILRFFFFMVVQCAPDEEVDEDEEEDLG